MSRERPGGALRVLEERYQIDESVMCTLLDAAMRRGASTADLFFEVVISSEYTLVRGRLRATGRSVGAGLGARVLEGPHQGCASTDDLTLASTRAAARTAADICREGKTVSGAPSMLERRHLAPRFEKSLEEVADGAAATVLQMAEQGALAADRAVEDVRVTLHDRVRYVVVARSDGLLVDEVQQLVRLHVDAAARRGTVRHRGVHGLSAREGVTRVDPARASDVGREAARRALQRFDAVDPPLGAMPVVLAAGESAALLHEAVGHALEADLLERGTPFSGRFGERVAPARCTVVDRGDLPDLAGSVRVDDEGQDAGRTVLIEDGVLRAALHDRVTAIRQGTVSTGNGRRDSFRSVPLPRMTCTYLRPGERDAREVVAAVERGLLCRGHASGRVDPATGRFAFTPAEAFWIEDGAVGPPVRDVTLTGTGPELLRRVALVGDDLEFGTAYSTCVKDGQEVPVSVGMPTTLISELTVTPATRPRPPGGRPR